MQNLYYGNDKVLTLLDNFPNLKNHQVDFFATGRFYDNGHYTYLSSDPAVYQFLMAKSMQLVTSVEDEYLKQSEFRYYIQPNGYYLPVYQAVNLYDAFDIIIRDQNYFDFYCFASSSKSFQLTNFFLNTPHIFDCFVTDYKHQTQTLNQQLNNDLRYLTSSQRSNITGTGHHKSPKRYYIEIDGETAYLTRKETLCCRHLLHGHTAKLIARKMGLSPRTVEGHLRNAKNRLKVRYNHELIALLRQFKFDTGSPLIS